MLRYLCKRCDNRRFYNIRRGKKRCRRCLYEFTPRLVKGIRLSIKKWRQIIEWFLLERSGKWIADRLLWVKIRPIKHFLK